MKRKTKARTGRLLPALVSLSTVTTLGVGLAVATSPAGAAVPLPDGKTSFTAAASCWEIKQNYSTSPSGVYWLVTPTLVAPEQFYCDMTTNGGGWVLIGRGREDWSMQYEGTGTPAQVRSPITGTGAFVPKQLPSKMIDGLLNGGRVDALPDGVRIRRATNVAGTSWQEVRFKFAKRDRWAWSLGAVHPVSSWSFGSTKGTGTTTDNMGTGTGLNRLDTRYYVNQGWFRGMAYGSSVTGRNTTTSYLWSKTSTVGHAEPFAQVFLRPKLRLADLTFPSVPDTGTPATEQSPLANNGATPGAWGVTGLGNGRDTELSTEVSAFAQIGDTVYVGGNFRYVQKGSAATGADKVEQRYLAAFDARTGDWIPEFRPVLNGQVKALAVLPSGLLVAGGEFTTASGQPSAAAVALDPKTGAKDSTFNISLQNKLTGSILQVRALKVSGGYLYLGGGFTHVTGGPSKVTVYSRGAARVDVTDGTPDGAWNPNLDGTVVAMDTDSSGNRVYAAGYFGTAQGLTASRAAELSATTARPNSAWKPIWSAPTNYQQAIDSLDSKVYVGGSQHSLFSWDTSSWARTSGVITRQGGDFQTLADSNGILYGSCHCSEWVYTGTYSYPNPGSGWSQADHIGWVGGFDASTGKFLPEFDPILKTRRGSGGWAVLTDSTGTTWFGGDFTHAVMANGKLGWSAGFVRFAPRDTVAPATPAGFTVATNSSTGARLSWASVPDADHYELIRDNRVVATTTSTYADVPAVSAATRYFVRAVDAAGNRSASTSVLTLDANTPGTGDPGTPDPGTGDPGTGTGDPGTGDPGGTPTTGTLIDNGATWRYRYDAAAWPAGWNQNGFDDSAWKQGAATLGFGSTAVATDIDFTPDTTSDRPISAQFRRTFDVADPAALGTVKLTVRADDAVVVYVNGTEVGRSNLPTGTLTQYSYANSSPRTSNVAAVTFDVPTSLLVTGQNTVAASVHLGYRATPDVSFDVKLDAS